MHAEKIITRKSLKLREVHEEVHPRGEDTGHGWRIISL